MAVGEAAYEIAELGVADDEIADISGGETMTGVLVFVIVEAAFEVSDKCIDERRDLESGIEAYCFPLLETAKR